MRISFCAPFVSFVVKNSMALHRDTAPHPHSGKGPAPAAALVAKALAGRSWMAR